MATFTDYLITIFSSQGAPQLQQALGQNAQAFQAAQRAANAHHTALNEAATSVLGLSASMSGLGQAMYPVFFAFYRSSPAVKFLAAEILAIIGVVKAATDAFIELEKSQFRLQLAFGHAGLGGQAGQFASFARQNQARTGISEADTMGLAAELATLRFNQSQIAALIPALQGAELAGLGKPGQIGSNLAKAAVGGETQALVDLGLDVNKIKRSSDKASEIIRQMVEKFGKDAAIQMSTLGGQVNALSSDWHSLLADLGDLLGPVISGVIAIVRHLIAGLRFFPWLLSQITSTLGQISGLGFLAPQSQQTSEAIKRAGINRERQNSDNLRKIEQNTRELQTTMARATLGAAGAAVRDAATIRNFRTAAAARG